MKGALLAAALLAAQIASAAPAAPAPEVAPPSRGHDYFTDLVLVDQQGRPMRLYSDLLAGKTVVVSSFFTSCTGVCPVINGKLSALQDRLGDRLGKDVYLLSISVDPETDTPAVLADYARRMKARAGWYFLTGDPANVRTALQKLGMAVTAREGHTDVLYFGAEPEGRWQRIFGLASADQLLGQLERFLAEE